LEIVHMNARQLRRAQERKERKLTRKTEQHNTTATIENAAAPVPSPARVIANRANAELSTGPKTAEGKAVSSFNSLKTGLTGRTVLLAADEVAAYEAHCLRLQHKWNPEGDDESLLVQSIADTEWRLRRIPTLEFAIYAKGRAEFAAQVDATTDVSDPALVDLETFLRYEKQLRNLALQEGRLNRQRDKHIAELRQLQSERLARQAEQAQAEVTATSQPSNNGFVFSAAPIEPFTQAPAALPNASESVFTEAQAA
jgi:hypothetical protein